jgi:hypothetical protein
MLVVGFYGELYVAREHCGASDPMQAERKWASQHGVELVVRDDREWLPAPR